jgi:hypothetical protein
MVSSIFGFALRTSRPRCKKRPRLEGGGGEGPGGGPQVGETCGFTFRKNTQANKLPAEVGMGQ